MKLWSGFSVSLVLTFRINRLYKYWIEVPEDAVLCSGQQGATSGFKDKV